MRDGSAFQHPHLATLGHPAILGLLRGAVVRQDREGHRERRLGVGEETVDVGERRLEGEEVRPLVQLPGVRLGGVEA